MTKWDFAGLMGAAFIVGGMAWAYPPAGLIVAGVMLLCAAILAGRKA